MSDAFRFEVDGMSAPSPVMDGQQVWTFDATGVQIVSDVADSRFTWRAFDRVLEGANGFGVGVGGLASAFAYLQHTRMRQSYRIVGVHWDRTGEISVRLDARRFEVPDDVSERRYTWAAIDAVHKVKSATVLRTAMSMIAIPDAAMPEGLSFSDFSKLLDTWRGTCGNLWA